MWRLLKKRDFRLISDVLMLSKRTKNRGKGVLTSMNAVTSQSIVFQWIPVEYAI